MGKINWEEISIKEFAGVVSDRLQKNDIEAVLVGGACVSIYSENEYESYDLDYSSYNLISEIKLCLKEIDFCQTAPNRFENKECKFYIEFVTSPVTLGRGEPITKFNELNTERGKITLLTPTDCVKDRLAAYYHWNDPQSLEQALLVAGSQKINLRDIETWSIKENNIEKFKNFKEGLKSKEETKLL